MKLDDMEESPELTLAPTKMASKEKMSSKRIKMSKALNKLLASKSTIKNEVCLSLF